MEIRKHDARLDPTSPKQEVSGGAEVGGVFELLSEHQIRFKSLIRYESVVGGTGSLKIRLENLESGASRWISNIVLNGTGVFLEASLLLGKGRYRWTSKLDLGISTHVNNPRQSAFAQIENSKFAMSTAGGGGNFSQISGRPNRAVGVRGQYFCLANAGERIVVTVSATPISGGLALVTPDTVLVATSRAQYQLDSAPLDFYLAQGELYDLTIQYAGGSISGAYLNVSL